MERRPNLIAPVILVALGLIVVGGVTTVLSGTEASPTSVAAPRAVQGGTVAVATPAATGTGAGGAADAIAPEENATLSGPTANVTACAPTGLGAGHGGTADPCTRESPRAATP